MDHANNFRAVFERMDERLDDVHGETTAFAGAWKQWRNGYLDYQVERSSAPWFRPTPPANSSRERS